MFLETFLLCIKFHVSADEQDYEMNVQKIMTVLQYIVSFMIITAIGCYRQCEQSVQHSPSYSLLYNVTELRSVTMVTGDGSS